MSQYFIPVVLNKKYKKVKVNNIVIASLFAHEWMESLKLTDHSWVGNNFVKNAMKLIALHKGKPFVWAGDYANENFKDEQGNTYNVYKLRRNIQPDQFIKVINENNIESDFKYIVNYSKREYVKIPDEPKNNNWKERIIHPLPILTADGNENGGGGTYRGINRDFVGRWAYDRIGVTNKRPHYKRLKIEFKKEECY